jgi:hypothetical protein
MPAPPRKKSPAQAAIGPEHVTRTAVKQFLRVLRPRFRLGSSGRMTVFILSGLFIGGLIGARLTVLALLPAAACTLGIAAAVSVLRAGAHDWI